MLKDFAAMNLKAKFDFNSEKIVCSHKTKNEFGESNKYGKRYELNGIFHTAKSKFLQNENASYFSEEKPLLMVLFNEVHKVNLGDTCEIRGNRYKFITINDVGRLGICFDIALELI